MRTNGFFQYEILPTNGSDFDEYGNPIAVTELSYSDKCECLIKTVTDNRKGVYEDGTFRQSSYEVLTEHSDQLFDTLRKVKSILLHRSDGANSSAFDEDLGEFAIQSVQPLLTVGRLRIIV